MSVFARSAARHFSALRADRLLLTSSLLRHGQRRCYALAQKAEESPASARTPPVKKGGKKTKAAPKEEDISLEERLELLEMLKVSAHLLPNDPYAQVNANYDLHIPSYRSMKKDATIIDHLKAFFQTQWNTLANAWHLRRLVSLDSLPGVKASPLSFKVFSLQSTEPSAWIAPFRKIALDTYIRVNQAVADRDVNTLKRLTSASEQEHFLKLMRAQDPSRVYVWKMHGEKEPCRVVSIRANMENLGAEPKFGNRYTVQALVRFDTLQSLQVYSKKGVLLHGSSEPKEVVEYLVFQKRMWYDSPWVIKERLYEDMEQKYKNMVAQ